MRIFFIFTFFCWTYTMLGQQYVSLEKMLLNYQERKTTDDLRRYDIIYGVEESAEASLLKTSLLPYNIAGSKQFRGEWHIEYFNDKPMLYLRKIVPLKESLQDSMLIYERELLGKYGMSKYGIPAKWYSGNLTILLCPQHLFGEIVTKELIELTVKEGEVISRNSRVIRTGEMERTRNPQTNSVFALIASLDGCWHSNLQYKLDLFDQFINFDFQKAKKSINTFCCSILLVTDCQGEANGYLLHPTKVTEKEELLMNKLLKRIRQLPRWSFGWLETVDGLIFRGRYLKASYSSDTGWQFTDYLSLDLKR